MTYHWIIPLLAAIANLVLVGLVYLRGRNTRPERVFVFLASMLVFWNLNFFIVDSVESPDLAFKLTWLFRMGVMFVPAATLHLILALQENRSRLWTVVLSLDYLLAFALAIASAFNLVVTSLKPGTWGLNSIQGPAYPGFTFAVTANFLGSLLLLVHDYRTTLDPRTKVQLKFWLFGAALAMPMGLTNLFPAYGIPIYPLGQVGNTVWVGVVAYAIVRHRLMDIDLVVSKGVAYVAAAVVVITPAFALSLIMQERVFGSVHYDFSFALLVMFLVIGALFPTLRLRTETQVERTLFRSKHEYRSVLSSFAKSIIHILDRERLIREVGDKLSTILRVDRVAVFMCDGNESEYRVRYSAGVAPLQDDYNKSHPLFDLLLKSGEPLLRDEIESGDTADATAAASLLLGNAWEVAVPFTASGRLLGFIGLGRKRDLDVFSTVDLDLLGAIAAQAAIALENARLYQELHKSQDIIQRADRMSALGTLAAGIAHEIRNPLVSIQTFFQLAPNRLGDEEFVTSFMALAENEVKRIADLVTELLTFARAHPDTIQEVDLDDTIDRTIRLLSPQANKHRVNLQRSGSHALPIIRVDPDRIKQVLINIILNGVQATPENGVVVVSAQVVDYRTRPYCQIVVRDTGPGIPADRREDIFNPFFTTKDKGTGLGLSIAHQIITEHGGFIEVESQQGHGCSFLIHLPIVGADLKHLKGEAALAS